MEKAKTTRKWLSSSNVVNAVLFIALLTFMLNPSAKAMMIRGLMTVGFFQPDLTHENTSKNVGTNLPQLALSDINGKQINLSELHGKVVFLNFWATWCPPCIAEMPAINQLHQKLAADKRIVFITVDVDGNLAKSAKFMKKHQLDLPLYQATSPISPDLLGNAIPTTIIFDKSGQVVFHHEGGADYANPKVAAYLSKIAE